jgi:hypothetical protein
MSYFAEKLEKFSINLYNECTLNNKTKSFELQFVILYKQVHISWDFMIFWAE